MTNPTLQRRGGAYALITLLLAAGLASEIAIYRLLRERLYATVVLLTAVAAGVPLASLVVSRAQEATAESRWPVTLPPLLWGGLGVGLLPGPQLTTAPHAAPEVDPATADEVDDGAGRVADEAEEVTEDDEIIATNIYELRSRSHDLPAELLEATNSTEGVLSQLAALGSDNFLVTLSPHVQRYDPASAADDLPSRADLDAMEGHLALVEVTDDGLDLVDSAAVPAADRIRGVALDEDHEHLLREQHRRR